MAQGQKITLGTSLGIAVWITGTAVQATHSPRRLSVSTTSTLPIIRAVTFASRMLMTYWALGASTLQGVCSSQIPIS